MPSPLLSSSRQLIVVTATNWSSTTGHLQRFARRAPDAAWQPVGATMPVCLGRAGLAWGVGLHPAMNDAHPTKREGDGCAPAGMFAITALFGATDPSDAAVQSARLPFLCATGDLKCIDDPASQHYNRIVDQREVGAIDWTSHEDMLRPDTRYAIGAVVAHNPDGLPSAGSCIFLHVWQDAATPTAGCTASALGDMREICQWLDATANPVLVQLPQAEYARYRDAWSLPGNDDSREPDR